LVISNYWGNKALNFLLNTGTDHDEPSNVYAALHTSNPGESGNPATEVAGGSYNRIKVDFAYASGKTAANIKLLKWSNLPYCIVTHVALWDHEDGGHVVVYAELSNPKTVATGQTFVIEKHSIAFKM
jgi:hypothetical protein